MHRLCPACRYAYYGAPGCPQCESVDFIECRPGSADARLWYRTSVSQKASWTQAQIVELAHYSSNADLKAALEKEAKRKGGRWVRYDASLYRVEAA